MKLNRRTSFLVLLLAVISAAWTWKYFEDRRSDAAAAGSGPPRDGAPLDDLATVPTSAVPTPPPSAWLSARTKRYVDLFRNWQCDVLVVPVQVEEAGFDRPNRQIMSADLSLALAGSRSCVADPMLVDIALGDGMRRRDPAAVEALAHSIKASTIVFAYAGHGEPGKMRVTLQVARNGGSGRDFKLAAAHSFDNLHYDETDPPFAVFHRQLPQMLAAVGLQTAVSPAEPVGAMPAALPDSLALFQHMAQEPPLARAAHLLFLAMLAPAEWRAADRLFAKAWVALENADAADPAVRMLRARILFHLQERPFALAQLADTPGPAADGLRAVLNGNLPPARQALAQLGDPWEQFFLGLEVHDLELFYQREPRRSASQVQQLLLHDSPWQIFAALRLGDRDTWGVSSTVWLKWLLDQSYPISGFSLTDSGIGRAMLDVFDRPDAEISALRHVYRLEQEQPQLWCCAAFDSAPRASDLLDLLDSRIEFTLGRQAYYLYSPQDSLDHALKLLEQYDSVLAGSPCAEALRAQIYWAQMGRRELGKNQDLYQGVHQSARLAVWWDQGQTADSNNMLWYMYQPPQDPAAPFLIRYTDDYPVRPYWSAHGHAPNTEQRLAFSTEDPEPLADLLKSSSGENRIRYLAMLDSRFLGGPDATQLRLDNLPAQEQTPEYLRAQIAADPDNYRYYSTLARYFINKSAFGDVARTMLSFPLYREESPNDPVGLANHASSWAHALFWLGATAEARPLFKIAADYRNGSGASGNSAARLALLDRDYPQAAVWFLNVAQHYNDMFDYREFLDLTFASGQDQAGWALFDRLVEQYDAPALWASAMTAHRKAGLGGTALRDWTRQRLARLPAAASRDDLLSYALLEEFTDRAPAADFDAYIKDLAGDPRVAVRPNGQIVTVTTPPATSEVLGPSQFGHERHAKVTSADGIPNRYAVLAQGLAAERAGRYTDAVAAFDRLSSYYKIEDGSLTFVLPYFAYAAAKTGDALGLQHYLDGVPEDAANYDILLGRAVFSALAGKHDLAQTQLDKAFHHWPYGTSVRDLKSGYEYLDTCAALFESTGNALYRQAALRLARALRQVAPARAYGHALVANLSDREEERVEALAMALYLDPQSRWAALAPSDLRAKAQNWTKRHSLFLTDSIWESRAREAAAAE